MKSFIGLRMMFMPREGVLVDPSPRAVACHWISISDYSPPYFTLELKSARGFYVRSLVHDLGIGIMFHFNRPYSSKLITFVSARELCPCSRIGAYRARAILNC